MDLLEKIRILPLEAGVYLYKNAEGAVIYVGKAKSLRHRVRSYFVEGRAEDAKTGSLLREAADVEFIVVDNEREALALENNLIKQLKPRFNILLRDDKTYPYIKLTHEHYPRIYVTRRLRKDGSEYFGPYFPASLAYRLAHFAHKYFLIPSCTVDLTRTHARPCLQYHIHRCLGPCVEGLTTDERYADAVHNLRLFLAGKHGDLLRELRQRRDTASQETRFEEAASYRDLISVVEDMQERQRMAAAQGDDADIVGIYREADRVAVNLFHMRRGQVVDRREFFWEGLPQNGSAAAAATSAGDALAPPLAADAPTGPARAGALPHDEFLGTVLKQLYLGQRYVPPLVIVPALFEDREALEQLLREQRGGAFEFTIPQRGSKRSMLELAQSNAQQSFEQRFRVMKPSAHAIQDALQESLNLPDPPERIECFDISHFQGAETVASMVVWQNGRMAKSEYRKFIIKGVNGIDDFRSMEEVVTRRYRAVQEQNGKMPSLVLIDGGLGQLHAAQRALESLEVINQPLASIAKREEIIYVSGQENEPVVLDHHSPVLHLIQMIRDESHRFAVTFHRQRREARDLKSGLLDIHGIGETTARRLLRHFGSLDAVRGASASDLASVVNKRQAAAVREHFQKQAERAGP